MSPSCSRGPPGSGQGARWAATSPSSFKLYELTHHTTTQPLIHSAASLPGDIIERLITGQKDPLHHPPFRCRRWRERNTRVLSHSSPLSVGGRSWNRGWRGSLSRVLFNWPWARRAGAASTLSIPRGTSGVDGNVRFVYSTTGSIIHVRSPSSEQELKLNSSSRNMNHRGSMEGAPIVCGVCKPLFPSESGAVSTNAYR